MKRLLIYWSAGSITLLSGSLGFVLLSYRSWAEFLGSPMPPLLQAYGLPLQYATFVLAGIALLVTFVARRSAGPQKTYGSAHFATLTEVRKAGLVMPRRQRQQTPPSSYLPLGTYHGHMIGLSEQQQESHVLLVAPTGKRKTSGVIIPGLLSEFGSRSLFINDIKGELIAKTAGALQQHMPVHIFRPTQPEQSLCYNPLAFVQTMEDAEDLAVCFIENTRGKSNEEFWNAAAKLLLTATILHLRETEPEAPFCRIADVLTGNSLEQVKTEPPPIW